MSDGKIFKEEKEPLSPLEVLVEIERKYSGITLRAERFERHIDDSKALENKVSDLDERIKELKEVQSSNEKVCSSITFCQNKLREEHFKLIDNNYTALSNLECKYIDLKKESDSNSANFMETIQKISNTFEEARSSFVRQDHFEAYKKFSQDQEGKIYLSIEMIKKDIKLLDLETKKSCDLIREHSDLHSKHALNIQDVKDSLDRLKTSVEKKMVDIDSSLDSRFKSFIEKNQNDIKSLKSELSISPSSLEFAKSELMKKIDESLLEASNAVIRVANSEYLVKLLDRKLENISALLKKLELMK